MQILREDWKMAMQDRITSGGFTEYTSAITVAMTWLALRLAERGIPFKVLNLGAGVKKITTKVDICPKCRGTGKF